MGSLHPGLILILGAVLVPFVQGQARRAVLLGAPALAGLALLLLDRGEAWRCAAFGLELTLLRVDGLSVVFATIFVLASFLGNLFALHEKGAMHQMAALAYAGSAVGAVLAGDLLTLFLFWEVVGLVPVLLVLARGTERAYGAAFRYAMLQILSGVLLLGGLALHAHATGSVAFGSLSLDAPGGWLLFFAFGIKCGWPLLHGWIPDAYPAATWSGPVFLGTYTTKLAVYALARGFAGTELLLPIGAAMALFALVYAFVENDLRRLLSYGMINQVGFMVCGVGIGSKLALNGVAAHAFCHILYEGLMFMALGAVMFRTGRTRATDLGGLYRTMPFTAVACLIGAASISAVPFLCGFVSKSMIVSAAADTGHAAIWAILVLASVGAFLAVGVRLPFGAFFGQDAGLRPEEAPRSMRWAMGLMAALCVGIGLVPGLLYGLLPHDVSYAPYTWTHLLTQLQLLLFAGLVYAGLYRLRLVPAPRPLATRDVTELYRWGARGFVRLVEGPLMSFFGVLGRFAHEQVPHTLDHVARNPAGAARLGLERVRLAWTSLLGSGAAIRAAHHRYDLVALRYRRGAPAATWPVGRTVLYATLALLVYLIVYLVQ